MSAGAGAARSGEITRADIEAKLRQIRGQVDSGAESARSVGLIVGVAAAVVVLGAIYVLGRRRGKRETTVVEVRRL